MQREGGDFLVPSWAKPTYMRGHKRHMGPFQLLAECAIHVRDTLQVNVVGSS
jgi:hypothetical protein